MESNTEHTAAAWQLLTSYILAFVKRFSLKSEVDSNGFLSEQLVCLQTIAPKFHCPEGKQEQLRAPMHGFQTPLPCGHTAGRGAGFVGDMILVEVEQLISSVLSLCMSPELNQKPRLCFVAVTISSSFRGTLHLVAQYSFSS